MKSTNYYIIQGWMVNELQLKGNNLILFAILYGFSQDADSKYTGTLNYLMGCMNTSKNTVLNCLDDLIGMSFIKKESMTKNRVTFCNYYYNEPVVQKLVRGGANSELGGGANFGIHNTIIDNSDESNIDITEAFLRLYRNLPKKGKFEIEAKMGIRKSSSKMLFKESKWADYVTLRDQLKTDVDFVSKFKGVDLKFYIDKADTWSENSGTERTERGWIRTLRDWMRDAKNKNELIMLPTKPEEISGHHNH